MFYRTAFCDLLRLLICQKASGWKPFLKMKNLGIGWKFEVMHPPINLHRSETSWENSSCPRQLQLSSHHQTYMFFEDPALYNLVELPFMLVVTQPLVRPRPLKLPSVIQFLRHRETLYSRHSTSWQLFPPSLLDDGRSRNNRVFCQHNCQFSTGIFLKYKYW